MNLAAARVHLHTAIAIAMRESAGRLLAVGATSTAAWARSEMRLHALRMVAHLRPIAALRELRALGARVAQANPHGRDYLAELKRRQIASDLTRTSFFSS